MEGDSVLSKILPGGAAEQAGKLGEGTTNTISVTIITLYTNVNNLAMMY